MIVPDTRPPPTFFSLLNQPFLYKLNVAIVCLWLLVVPYLYYHHFTTHYDYYYDLMHPPAEATDSLTHIEPAFYTYKDYSPLLANLLPKLASIPVIQPQQDLETENNNNDQPNLSTEGDKMGRKKGYMPVIGPCDKGPGPIIGYTHHKAGSTWLLKIFREVCYEAGMVLIMDNDEDYTPAKGTGAYAHWTNKQIAHRQCVWRRKSMRPPVEGVKGFHVVRDPRDMVVSGYYSHKYTHPPGEWLDAHRKKLQMMNEEEGIEEEIRFASNESYLTYLSEWPYGENKEVIEAKFEDLTNETRQLEEFIVLFYRLGMPTCVLEKIPYILDKYSFERMRQESAAYLAHRQVHQNDPSMTHYRKGSKGDWRNHLTPTHKAMLQKCCGSALVRYGYAKSTNDW
jgi:hypothetical protein